MFGLVDFEGAWICAQYLEIGIFFSGFPFKSLYVAFLYRGVDGEVLAEIRHLIVQRAAVDADEHLGHFARVDFIVLLDGLKQRSYMLVGLFHVYDISVADAVSGRHLVVAQDGHIFILVDTRRRCGDVRAGYFDSYNEFPVHNIAELKS